MPTASIERKVLPSIAAAPAAKRPFGLDALRLRPQSFFRWRDATRWTEWPSTMALAVTRKSRRAVEKMVVLKSRDDSQDERSRKSPRNGLWRPSSLTSWCFPNIPPSIPEYSRTADDDTRQSSFSKSSTQRVVKPSSTLHHNPRGPTSNFQIYKGILSGRREGRI